MIIHELRQIKTDKLSFFIQQQNTSLNTTIVLIRRSVPTKSVRKLILYESILRPRIGVEPLGFLKLC
jgi:hypothetical protein